MLALLKVTIIMGQLMYWIWFRDESRDEVIWDACLNPGENL